MIDIERKTIDGLIAGDDACYDLVIEEFYMPVYRYVLRMCRNTETAQDITQETFIAVWKGILSFKGESRFGTWVFAIAYHQFLRFKQKNGIKTVCIEDYDELSQPVQRDLLINTLDTKDRIKYILDNMNESHREVVHLIHIQGFSYCEASIILDVPVGTLKSRMNAAMNSMRKLMNNIIDIDDQVPCIKAVSEI